MNIENGILYIAFKGRKEFKRKHTSNRVRELIHSVKSVRKFHPKIPIALFTNEDPNIDGINIVEIVKIKRDRVKQDFMPKTPFKNTLYLDCDTEIVTRIAHLFSLVNSGRFDMAAAHDHIRFDKKKAEISTAYKEIPESFPEYNSGVILYRKNVLTDVLFEKWQEEFEYWVTQSGDVRDQPGFRIALWKCDGLRLYTLPQEYNQRNKKTSNVVTRIKHQHDLWRRR